jgi:fermentation-respiration switch protein FrsA (DUF1100 family)
MDYIAKVETPLLWLHGDADFVVPLRLGRKLFDAAREPKQAVVTAGGGHNNLMSDEIFERAVVPFVEGLMLGEGSL